MTGRFISLEGGEGAGKSTQCRMLADWLRGQGVDVVMTREPGGTAGAEAIRELILSGNADKWGARAEALLFAAARADHVEKLITPALANGQWVISDRFVDSSRAYQSGGSGLADSDIMALHSIGSSGLLPDLTLLLELPHAEADARTRTRDAANSDRIGGRDAAFHTAVARAFHTYAEAEPDRFRVIDASGSVDAVHAAIVAAVAPLMA